MELFRWTTGRTCDKCGKILQDNYLHDVCVDCRESDHHFEKGYSCVQYGINERELLFSFKYGGKAFIGEKIADVMADKLATVDFDADLVIPVPMHKSKERKRGYNQADIIAKHLAKKLTLPYSKKLLLRVENTAAMSGLSAFERHMNMENAFSMTENAVKIAKGKRILLVDDIYTTGSTVSACSKVLISNGACEVRVVTFAAGANLLKFDKEDGNQNC